MLRTNQRGEGLTRVFVFIFGWLPFFCFVFDHGLLSSSPQPISLCQLFSFLFLILRSLFYREKSMRARVDLSCWFESGILPARLRKSKAKDWLLNSHLIVMFYSYAYQKPPSSNRRNQYSSHHGCVWTIATGIPWQISSRGYSYISHKVIATYKYIVS